MSCGFLSCNTALAADSSEPTLKAIDPSTAQIDAPPPADVDNSAAATNSSNPFNSNIQGQPLGKSLPSASGGVAERPVEDATPQEESRVTNLEQKAFGATYSEHEVADRLDHLEKEVLGGQKQGSLAERIARLETKLLGGSAFGATPTTDTGPSASGAYGASGYGANTGGAASGAYGMNAPTYNNPGLGWVTGKSSAPPQAATNWMGAGQAPPGQRFASINAPPAATVPSQPAQSAPLSTSGWINPDGGSKGSGSTVGSSSAVPPPPQSQQPPLSTSGWISPASQQTQTPQKQPPQQQPQQQPLSTSGWVNPASQQQQQMPSQSGWVNPASQPQQQVPSQSGWINPASQQQQQIPSQSGWVNPASQPQQQQAPSQSGWINPASQPQQQQAPSQSGWINPASQPQQQVPSQSGWINPGAPNVSTEPLRPIQSMPGQNMPQQNMPPQTNPGNYGWNPPQQQMPPQQRPPQQQLPPQMIQRPQQNVRPAGGISADAQLVASSIVYDGSCGDYVSSIRKFPGGNGSSSFSYAHWKSFPVKIRVAGGSPDSWQRSIDAVIARWGQYVPVKLALPNEVADVEVSWVNTLPKGLLGVTRLGVVKGRMHTWIYLLRPSFYAPEVPERALSHVFMREVGHALGLFGKSDHLGDLMYEAFGKTSSKAASIAQRDVNTLKRVYEGPALPDGLSLETPMEWATSY